MGQVASGTAEAGAQRGATSERRPNNRLTDGPTRRYSRAALKSVETESSRSGRAKVFQQLHPFLQGDCPRLAYREAAEALGLAETAVRMAVSRPRRRCRDALRRAVAETLSDPKEIGDELRYLIRIQGE